MGSGPPRPSFRDTLARLDRENRLLRLPKEVDARHLSAYELLRALPDVEYRTALQAWGAVRERRVLGRDEDGRSRIRPT